MNFTNPELAHDDTHHNAMPPLARGRLPKNPINPSVKEPHQ
jgi:hypothetical protein